MLQGISCLTRHAWCGKSCESGSRAGHVPGLFRRDCNCTDRKLDPVFLIMEKTEQHIINSENPVISIRGLYKSFDELHVLKGIDLTVSKGENVAILGKSGTGKSVLIKMIVGLLTPDKGEVIVLGKQVDKLNAKELDALRLRIGFSFQNSALYDSMNIRQNLEFPLIMDKKNLSKKEVAMAVEEVLEAVGLKDKMSQMPADLSGGQRKRIGIARTLILKPEIMLYDEPTAGLVQPGVNAL